MSAPKETYKGFENLLNACSLDETKLKLLLNHQKIWFGQNVGLMFNASSAEDMEYIAQHILDTNRIHKVEGEINSLYERALQRDTFKFTNRLDNISIFNLNDVFKHFFDFGTPI